MKKLLLNCFLLLLPFFVISQNFTTWTGSGNWSNGANWTSGTGYGQLQFLGSGGTTVNADAAMNQWRLYFNSGTAYNISGSGTLSLFDFGGNPSWVLNEGAASQIINAPIIFADTNGHYAWITTKNPGALTFSNTVNIAGNVVALRLGTFNAGAPITINGLLSGNRPLDIGKDETGADRPNTRVFLNGVNSGFSGITTMYAGTLTVPANSALGTNKIIIGNGAVTTTLTITGDTQRSQEISVADGSTAAVIDVPTGKNFELTGLLSQTGSNQATKIGKSGHGILTLTGSATYQGQMQIGQGTVIVNNNTALGLNTSTANRGVDLGLNVGDISEANNVSLLVNNGITVGQSVFVANNASGATRTIALNGSGSASFTNEIFLGGELTLDGGSGTLTMNGPMVNTSGVKVVGGTVVLGGNNTYTGSTTVGAGILRLGADNRISSASPIVLAGGTFSTGSGAGFTDTLGTLNVSGNPIIALGTGNHSLTFANSSGVSWNGTSLAITGWGGTAGQSNTAGGKIFVGAGGLTAAQLAKVFFIGYAGTPIILPSGELVPPGPTLSITSGATNNGAACIGTAATTITYTITNTGATAAGVTVVSNNPEFVVSNAPATVSAGGTATYQVTFTPATAGTRNATITINTTTPGSNAPITSALTGTGNPLPTGTISGTTSVCRNSTSPLITFTAANGTAPYTFTYVINGGTNQFVTTQTGNSVTVAVPTNNGGTFTYTLLSVQDSSSTNCQNPQSGSAIVTVQTGTTYYADSDNDGFGDAAAPIVSCSGQPVGTVANSTDCAPADPLKWRTGNFYVDADNDGYYNGNPEATSVCYGSAAPGGYTDSIIGTDCDDANPESNPNHVEIAGNGIDDNCDGTTDEAGPQIGLIANQCGITLTNIANTLYSNQVAGAQGYRFEVTNGANVRTYDSATNSFSLLNLTGGVSYATTYSIRVAVKTSGFWRSYATACNITTPAVPATTNVIASQCGIVLTNIANMIYVNQVTAANQYRFEVTDLSNTSNVRTYDSAVNRFSLPNLSGGVTYGRTYAIRVALRFGSVWQDYGAICEVTTPSAPGVTSLIASQCGITVSNRWASLYANQVPDAQGYRFEVSDGVTTRFVDRSVSNFALGQVQGGVAANTTYTIRVSVLYNGVYGTFGSACTVSTSGVFTRQSAAPVAVFEAKSYPNPFVDNFSLELNTTSEQNISVQVYDMIGRLVESREIPVSGFGAGQLGSSYPSGVYNVIVSQGEQVETLRVIKR